MAKYEPKKHQSVNLIGPKFLGTKLIQLIYPINYYLLFSASLICRIYTVYQVPGG